MRVLASLLAAAVVLAFVPRASAFCRTTTDGSFVWTPAKPCADKGVPLSWASSCVGWSVQRSASVQVDLATARSLVADAFAQWSGAACNASCGGAPGKPTITAQDLGPVDCGEVEYNQKGDNANVVVFRDGAWPNDGVALALTTVTYRLDTGEIYDADVEVQSNPLQVKLGIKDPIASDEYDLRSILTHEIGHFLGMAHTQAVNATSTMFERYNAGQTFMRDIAADDACGICTIYPPTRKATCDVTPNGGLGNTCGGGDPTVKGCGCSLPGEGETTSGALATLALGVVWATRRRRRCA